MYSYHNVGLSRGSQKPMFKNGYCTIPSCSGRLQDQFSFFDFTLRLKILMSNATRYNSNLKCENIVIVYEKKQRQLYENHNLRAQNVLGLGNIFLNRGAKPSPKILLGNSSHLVHQFKIRLEFCYAIYIYYMYSRGLMSAN